MFPREQRTAEQRGLFGVRSGPLTPSVPPWGLFRRRLGELPLGSRAGLFVLQGLCARRARTIWLNFGVPNLES